MKTKHTQKITMLIIISKMNPISCRPDLILALSPASLSVAVTAMTCVSGSTDSLIEASYSSFGNIGAWSFSSCTRTEIVPVPVRRGVPGGGKGRERSAVVSKKL